MKKAVVLHSGGLDSTTVLYLAKSQGFAIYALSFNYGQRHSKELEIAHKVAALAGVLDHKEVTIPLHLWGGSALTDRAIDVPDFSPGSSDIPITYVPARNLVFLSIAASYAESIGSTDIFIGVSQVDYSGYVDCRPAFIEAMEAAVNQGTVCAVEQGRRISIHAPFMNMTKAEEIALGIKLGVPYEHTWSCYKGGEKPCGTCDSCQLRQQAFAKAGLTDPLKPLIS